MASKNKLSTLGFTLIELLVVISIIGLISTIVLVSTKGSRDKARLAKVKQFSSQVSHALGAYAVGIWRFEEGEGIDIHDESGYGNHGTFHGNPTPVFPDGVYSGTTALQFDGVDDYVDCGNGASLQITGDQTYEFWINPKNFTARRNPINKAYGGEGTITLEQDASFNYYWGVSGANAWPYQRHNSVETIPANKWTHVVHTRDLTNNIMSWYFNGVIVNTKIPSYSEAVASANDLWIGNGYTNSINGMIDEVRIYNRALSAAEIKKHYAAGAAKHGIALNDR